MSARAVPDDRRGPTRCKRATDIDRLSATIPAAGEPWEEIEIAGKQAIVLYFSIFQNKNMIRATMTARAPAVGDQIFAIYALSKAAWNSLPR
ncbi:MAG: hypothetical protein LC791_14965 [Acidobacteria bacterium]|nr:hypothetical protein [Acidobacteriota bacterium]